MSKSCSKCKIEKDDAEFYFRSDKPHLLQSSCKDCIIKDRRVFREKYLERFKLKDRMYHARNKERRNNYLKKWQKENRTARSLKDKIKRHTDINFAMRSRLHNRIRMALKRNSKFSTSSEYLGCPISEFREYFYSMFVDGMTWNNFLNGDIHIDHIVPCVKFDLSKEKEQKKCFHYTNLQPLWAKDNILKGSKEVYHR